MLSSSKKLGKTQEVPHNVKDKSKTSSINQNTEPEENKPSRAFHTKGDVMQQNQRSKKVKMSVGDRIYMAVIYLLLIAAAIITLYPFLNVAFTSFYSTRDMTEAAKKIIYWPKYGTLSNYKYVLQGSAIWRAYFITISRTIVGTLLSMVMTVLTAYALSKSRLPFRRPIMMIFFFTMIFKGGMVPTYLIVKAYRLTDTFWALIIPGMLNVYNMIIMRTFFEGLPTELEEAAVIDGCSNWGVLGRIVLPISKPVLASISLFYAVWHWNSFFDVVLYISKRTLWPLQTLLRETVLTMSLSELNAQIADANVPPSTPVVAATVMISTIPILVVYPFLQKYFVKGVMIGAVKG